MPQKPPVVDYEPVTRSARPKVVPETDGDKWPGASWTDPGSVSEPVYRVSGPQDISAPQAAGNDQYRTTMLKRGHALSFAGVVLFTLILYFRPYELFPWLSWASSSAFVVALLTLAIFVPTQLGMEGKITFRPKEINLALMLLVAAMLSVPLALQRTLAWSSWVEYLKVIVMFIVMVNVVRTEKRLKVMLLLTLITSCILSAAAVNDYRMGRFITDLAANRIRGFIGNLFDNPNDLALHLVTMIPLALGLLLASRGGLKKLFFAGSAVLIICGVVVTLSRGGFIGMVFAIGMLVFRLAKHNKWMIATFLPVALLFFVLLAPGGFRDRMATTSDDSGIARFDELKRSLFIAAHHPLFGVGMNNYIFYSNYNHASHNGYTQVASELGFPAMFVYISFLVIPLIQLRRIGRETSGTRRSSGTFYMAAGLEASLFGYMVTSFFLSVSYLWYVYYLVGYAICFRRIYEASKLKEHGDGAASSDAAVADKAVNRNTLPRLESAPSAVSNRAVGKNTDHG